MATNETTESTPAGPWALTGAEVLESLGSDPGGLDASHGAGTWSRATCTAVVTIGALPDVSSMVIVIINIHQQSHTGCMIQAFLLGDRIEQHPI